MPFSTSLSATTLSGNLPYIAAPAISKFVGVAPFKLSNAIPYGNWPNTTKCNIAGNKNLHQCPILQTTYRDGTPLDNPIEWKCSEVAYHAQKLLDYKQKLIDQNTIKKLDNIILKLSLMPETTNSEFLQTTNSEFLPKNDWTPILENVVSQFSFPNKQAFETYIDAGRRSKSNYDRMKFVISLKLQQHPELMEQAKFFALNGLIPVEYSRKDDTWASGPDGHGLNWLGIIIFQLGAEELENIGQAPKVPSILVESEYNLLKNNFFSRLTHNSLDDSISNIFTLPCLVYVAGSYNNQPAATSSSSSSNATTKINYPLYDHSSAHYKVMQATGCIIDQDILNAKRDKDRVPGRPDVLKLTFSSMEQAKKFVNDQIKHLSSLPIPIVLNHWKQPVVILTEDITNKFFDNKKISNHGSSNQFKTWDSLEFEQRQSYLSRPAYQPNNKRPLSPSSINSHDESNGPANSKRPKPITTVYNQQLQSSSSSAFEATTASRSTIRAPKSATERVLAKIPGATNVSVALDINNATKKVLKVRFANSVQASVFARSVGSPPSYKPNNIVVVLGEDRADQFFIDNDIRVHGFHRRTPMMEALEYEQNNPSTSTRYSPSI